MVDVPVFTEDQPVTTEDLFSDREPDNATPRPSPNQAGLTADLAAVAQRNSDDTSFEELRQQNRDIINIGEELVLRNEAKLRKQQAERAAIDAAATEEILSGNEAAAMEFLDLESARAAAQEPIDSVVGYSALEELGVRAIQNDEIVNNPDLHAATQVSLGDTLGSDLDLVANQTTKALIFQRKIGEYEDKLRSEGKLGFMKQAGEYAAMFFLPWYDAQGRLNVNNVDTGNLRPGKIIQGQMQDFWANADSMTVEEFEAATDNLIKTAEEQSGVFGVNESLALQVMAEYQRGTIGVGNVIATDIVAGLDTAILAAPFLKVASGGIKGLAGVAKSVGARQSAAVIDTSEILKTTRTINAAEDVEETVEQVEAVRDLFPTALKPTSLIEDSQVGISGSLSNKLDEIEQLGREIEHITTQGRVSDSQLEELIQRKLTRIRERDPNITVEDYRIATDPVTKVSSIETFIGKKAGGGYASEAAAKGAATRRGFADGVEIVEESGNYFIKQVDVVEELAPNGVPLVRRPDNSADVIPESGPITAGIKSPDLLQPADLVNRRQEAQIAEVQVRERVIKPLAQEINKLGRKRLEHLNTVMTMGRNQRTWFGIDEFALNWRKTTGADPTEQDFIAYAAAKQINDIDFAIHNNHLYTDLARRGAQTIDVKNKVSGFDFSNLTAFRLNPDTVDLSRVRLFDVDDNIVRTGKADVAAEEFQDLARKLESGDYEAFRLREGVQYEGDPVHVVLTSKSNLNIKPLARQQLNYVAGGHTFRRTKWFAKQAQKGVYKDGTEYILAPRTLSTYRTEGIAKGHVESVNNALRAYREYRAGEVAGGSRADAARSLASTRAAIADSPFESFENLEDLVNKGKIDYTEDFEVVFDRGLPSAYNDVGNAENLFFRDDHDALDGTAQWLQSTGRDYYGRKTEGLLSPHEEADVVLDPLQGLAKGIQHAARTHAYDNYINRAIEEWVRVATPLLDGASLGGRSDARHAFFNGRILDNVRTNDPSLAQKLEENRTLVMRQMGVQTPSQQRFEAAKRNLARFIEGDSQGGLRSTTLMKLDNIRDNNPVNAINALVFDAWLGLFDVSQMFVQTQTIFTAVAASPRFGAEAVGSFMPMRWMMVNKSENLLDFIAKRLAPIHNQAPEDFKRMIRTYRDSGWNAPGGEISYLDNFSNSVASSGALFKIQQGRRAGRIFFNEAERWNRMVAYQIAWKETREALPKLATDSEEFLATVNKRTNDFSLSMTAASNSKIQQGIFSPVTRFMGYQMRMLEAIWPAFAGGNPAFSGAAKARILASQVLLYGSKGLPFGQRISDVVQDMYAEVVGEELPFEATRYIESGTIDGLLYSISGGDLNTDFAERTGFGRGLDYTFDRAMDGSMASMLEFLGGPAFSFSSRYAESVNRVLTYFKGTRGPLDLDAQDANFVLNELVVKHINSLKRANKGIMIYRLGQVNNPKTGRKMYDATKLEAVAAAAGIPLFEDTERSVLTGKLQDTKDEIRDVAGLIAKLDREAFRHLANGDDKAAKNVTTQAALILASYADDPLLMQQIARSAMTQLGYTKSEWEALLERIQRTLGPDAVPQVPVRLEQE